MSNDLHPIFKQALQPVTPPPATIADKIIADAVLNFREQFATESSPPTTAAHTLFRESEGEGLDERITPRCTCGWTGYTESVSNDWCFTNLRDQSQRHLDAAGVAGTAPWV